MIAPARPDDDAPDEPVIDLRAVVIALAIRDVAPKEIAEKTGVPVAKVYRWINKAFEDGLMGKAPHAREFGLRTECTCRENPLKPGTTIACVSCCSSGWDHHPAMHADPLPKDRRSYKPSSLKGGSGDAAADESAGQEAAAEAREDGRLGARAGRRAHAKGRRR